MNSGGWRSVFLWVAALSCAACDQSPPPPITPPNATASQDRIQQKLEQIVDIDVTDEPLEDVLADLSKRYDVPIWLDTPAIRSNGYPPLPLKPVTLRVSGVRLRSALRLLLIPDGYLTYLIEDDRVRITPIPVAEMTLENKLYFVADLFAADDPVDEFGVNLGTVKEPAGLSEEESLAALLESTIEPESWNWVGGPGKMQISPGALLVSGAQDVQEDIARLLASLRQMDAPDFDGRTPMPLFPVPRAPADQSPSERAVAQALGRRVTLSFVYTPLDEIVADLPKRYGAPFVFDRSALNDVGLRGSEPVSIDLHDVPLPQALERLLEPNYLTWLGRDEVIFITTLEEAETELSTRLYPVADVLDPDSGFFHSSLIGIVTSCVAPESWDEVGGPGSVSEFPGALVVAQTREVHKKLETFLQQLRLLNDPTCVDFQQRVTSPDVARLEGQLDEETVLVCVDTRLDDAFDFVKELHRLPNLHIDRMALNDVGLDEQTLVTVSLVGVSLRSALNAMLRDLDLSWFVRDNVLIITTLEEVETRMKIRPYRLGQITDGFGGLDVESLISLVTSICEPESWDEVGGPGTVVAAPGGIMVAQTHHVHDQVRHLLTELRRFRNPDEDFSQPPVRNDGEKRLRQALQQEITLEVTEVPFSDVIADLSRQNDIRIYLHPSVSDEAELGSATPISIVAQDRPLGDVLEQLCLILSGKGGLTWNIVNESVCIAHEDILEDQSPPFRLHRVPAGMSEDRAIQSITTLIAPDTWDEVGGAGSVVGIPGGLVVRNSRRVQEQVSQRLQRMRDAANTGDSQSERGP